MYGLMRTAITSDNLHWLMGDLRQGDFVATSRPDLKAIINGQLNASYPVLNEITNWRKFYAVINSTSLFIERSREIVEADKRYTPVNNNVDVAQARALRAFAYFYMVRIWGDVPLLTSSHDGNFEQHDRTAQAKVLAFAESELILAAKVLPYYYGGTDPQLPGEYFGITAQGLNGVLFTKISAYALLAHVSAWQGRYIDTEIYTKFIMDNYTKGDGYGPRYINMDELTGTGSGSPFAYKRGTIIVGFSSEYGNGESTANGHIEQLTLAQPLVQKIRPDIYVPKEVIAAAFTDRKDLRFGLDTITKIHRTPYFVNFTTDMPIFKKIAILANGGSAGSFAIFSSTALFTRLEELTLLRAEALAVIGQRTDAIANLNIVLSQRGVAAIEALSTKDLIDEIFAERRRELMGEGWRWYDLIRYNKIKGTNPDFNKLITEKGIYWPISKDVINANPMITQNTYWK
ncbi:RagB/SusD family nutrient uptake outer membrane protein [Pedobacter sp. LMG 31462]|uniref:RagB/SusD family nutrient uptake outer membrane protein n=2 Tax=Pedobacter gandavensis TaxID=2679963 RepID=A0ABR6EXT9_9SPHI|nr:RagB/SusD family nutrient uptake outer membrane protein [Pedobacter gandavensis]